MNNSVTEVHPWKKTDAQLFWGEIAPREHVVQLYEDELSFTETLSGFVTGGIRNGDSVIVIATTDHIQAVNKKLEDAGFDPFTLKLKDQYIPIDADSLLKEFIIDGRPDEYLFSKAINELIAKAKRYNRSVRAFGEMVALLWAKGNFSATIQLEHLWNRFAESNAFSLFCAYPKNGFEQGLDELQHHVCCAHSRMISAAGPDSNDLFYKVI